MNSNDIQIPWAWYIVRAGGLVGFLLLYVSIFAGTVSRLPGISKYFLRLHSLNFHCWISLQALVFALVHGIFLIFDKAIQFGPADVFIPFHSKFEPGLVALGVIAFYLMAILVITSYLRKYISAGLWRSIHFLNIALYFLSITHALYLGTDLKSGTIRQIFIWANAILLALMLANLAHKIWSGWKNKPMDRETSNVDENLYKSISAGGEERSDQNL